MKRIFIIAVFVSLGLALQAQSFKIIVNSQNSISSLSNKEISDIFLKKHLKWQNNDAIVPVDLGTKSSIRENFSTAIHGKSISAVKSYWQQFVFAGKGTPPIEKNGDDEVIEYIKRTPGAIGYVSAGANVSGIKVINQNN